MLFVYVPHVVFSFPHVVFPFPHVVFSCPMLCFLSLAWREGMGQGLEGGRLVIGKIRKWSRTAFCVRTQFLQDVPRATRDLPQTYKSCRSLQDLPPTHQFCLRLQGPPQTYKTCLRSQDLLHSTTDSPGYGGCCGATWCGEGIYVHDLVIICLNIFQLIICVCEDACFL